MQDNRSEILVDKDLGALSVDDMIGGKIRLRQPVSGYRVSMDTIMLQAVVPAKAGDTVLEAGTGTGAAALCLARRIDGVYVTGLELQESLLRIAEQNIEANGLKGRVSVVNGCVSQTNGPLKAGTFDHVMVNPPYLDPGSALSSPSQTKNRAHMNSTATLKDWVDFAVNYAQHKASVSFIFRADRIHELIYLLYGKVGDLTICPLWPRHGIPAKRVIIQGRKGVHGVTCMTPGIALHSETERYTQAAEHILRDGQAIDLIAARKAHVTGKPLSE
jgi:tRNA1(Val) A37 N6-methylase TrmN6